MNQIAALLESLRSSLPAASKVIVEGAGNDVSQATLTAPIEHVARAIAAIPNTSNHFPSRESYLAMGYALKAALPDDEPEALALFHDWCSRWSDGTNEPDIVDADWRRMKPPFRRGASWLFDTAAEYGDFDRASVWWEPIVDTEPLFPIEGGATQRDDVYPLLTIDEIVTRPPPTFLVDDHILDVSLGFLYSDPGAGKSFLALDMGLHIAYNMPSWQGYGIHAPEDTVVLYIAAEGSRGFRNRIKAWLQFRNIDISSKRFRVIEKTIDFLETEDIDKLMRTVRSIPGMRACLIIVDTVSRALPGSDENLQKEMTIFVQACSRLQEAFSCAVLGVHHANRNGDMRGSSVLKGAGDFVFKLTRKPGAAIGEVFCEKLKDGEDGWTQHYRFEKILLGEEQSSLVVCREDMNIGPATKLTPATSAAVLDAMRTAWAKGEPWSVASQDKERRAVRRMVVDFGFAATAAEELLNLWQQTGVIEVATVDKKSKRQGFRVLAEPLPSPASVFD